MAFVPGLLLLRALRYRPVGRAVGRLACVLAAVGLSVAAVAAVWYGALWLWPGEGTRRCLLLTAGSIDAAALLLALFTAPGAPALPPAFARRGSSPRPAG